MVVSLISNLTGETRNSIGMVRLAKPIRRVSDQVDKLDIKRHCHGFLFSMHYFVAVVVVALLFYVHGKHLRSCRDGQLT